MNKSKYITQVDGKYDNYRLFICRPVRLKVEVIEWFILSVVYQAIPIFNPS